MTRVIWSPRALDDLDTIEAYIANDNATAARRLVVKIVARAKQIELFPESGGFVEEDASLSPGSAGQLSSDPTDTNLLRARPM